MRLGIVLAVAPARAHRRGGGAARGLEKDGSFYGLARMGATSASA